MNFNRHFLSTYILLILSNCRIDLMIFGGNRLINLPWLVISQVLSAQLRILEHQNKKQKLQVPEAPYTSNIEPKLNRINFETVLMYLNVFSSWSNLKKKQIRKANVTQYKRSFLQSSYVNTKVASLF